MADLELEVPTWVSLDTGGVNKWIDEKVSPAIEAVDSAYTFLMELYSYSVEALDFVVTKLQVLDNPLLALLRQIISLVEGIVNDFRNISLYATYDRAISAPFKLGKFAGGYQRFVREITEKATNKKDPTRPDFSSKSAVFSAVLYADVGVTNVGTELRQLFEAIRKIVLGMSKFELTSKTPLFLPPNVLPIKKYKTATNSLFHVPAEQLILEDEVVGFLVEWQTTPSKRTNFIELDLPPACYTVTVTTRANPLPLVVKRKLETSANPDGQAEKTHKLLFSQNSTRQATSLCVSESSDFGDYEVVALDGAKEIPLENIKKETKTFYFNTSNLGAVIGGVDYSLSLSYEDLPQEFYDTDKNEVVQDIEAYYVYVRAHQTELDGLSDGDELKVENRNPPNDIIFTIKEDTTRKSYFLSNTADMLTPDFSNPQETPTTMRDRLEYISALRVSFLYFIALSEKQTVLPSEYGFDPFSEEDKRRLYDLFNVKSGKGMLQEYSSSKSDVEDFRDEIIDEIEIATLLTLDRGVPDTTTFKLLKEHMDNLNGDTALTAILANEDDFNEDPQSFDEALQEGLFPDGTFGYGANPKNTYASIAVLATNSEDRELMAICKKGTPNVKTPLVKYFEETIGQGGSSRSASAVAILTRIRQRKQVLPAHGEWIRSGLFLDPLFLETLAAFKFVQYALDSLIQAILKYIEILKQRIEAVRAFVERIKKILEQLLALRFPAGIKLLFSYSAGTQGFLESVTSALNPPESGEFILSTYGVLLFGGIPTAFVDLLVSMSEG